MVVGVPLGWLLGSGGNRVWPPELWASVGCQLVLGVPVGFSEASGVSLSASGVSLGLSGRLLGASGPLGWLWASGVPLGGSGRLWAFVERGNRVEIRKCTRSV